ncbi:MAG TPA: ArsB/NhaD family transporter [Nocardioides sp.]|uniref:ArsB/NhaD family transporter n=1 Tax=Nocardioides sp. TaxID=35761 RepID=UPI002C2EF0E3|nr:ArsB/NhaD family transporter [Nocardioides sp.]HQR27334.1 ArsB/NhaD family transporter [Nocardioides sp.]
MPFGETAALAIFVGAYVLIATERIHRVAAALGGAALMLLLQLTDGHAAFYSEHAGIDWNVIFLLLGMMVIVGVVKTTGLFEALAIHAAKRARGRPYLLMALLAVITAVASALLDNVTTMLLIAPVTFLVCERLALAVGPFLIAEVLASNTGGMATLIGDPPNIIIGSRAGLSFNDFLVHLAPLAAVMTAILVVMLRWLFPDAFHYDPDRAAEVMAMSERDAITDVPLLVRSVGVLVIVIAGFVLHPILHYEPSVVALLGAGLLLLISPVTVEDALVEVEWATLVFFMALFVMVGALVETGSIDRFAQWLADRTGGNLTAAAFAILLSSMLLSGIVDNIPYVVTMAPVVSVLVAQHPAGQGDVLWWALAIGADLGGNATAVGASANVVVLGMAARYGSPISFWEFTRKGLVVVLVSAVVSSAYLWLRYLA